MCFGLFRFIPLSIMIARLICTNNVSRAVSRTRENPANPAPNRFVLIPRGNESHARTTGRRSGVWNTLLIKPFSPSRIMFATISHLTAMFSPGTSRRSTATVVERGEITIPTRRPDRRRQPLRRFRSKSNIGFDRRVEKFDFFAKRPLAWCATR